MACINVQITTDMFEEASVDDIFAMLDRLNDHLKDDRLPMLSVSADWTDEDTGDLYYFNP